MTCSNGVVRSFRSGHEPIGLSIAPACVRACVCVCVWVCVCVCVWFCVWARVYVRQPNISKLILYLPAVAAYGVVRVRPVTRLPPRPGHGKRWWGKKCDANEHNALTFLIGLLLGCLLPLSLTSLHFLQHCVIIIIIMGRFNRGCFLFPFFPF